MPILNLFWPSLYLQNGAITVISIIVALATEGFFLWRITQFSFRQVAIATLAMNLVSTLIGVALRVPIEQWLGAAAGSNLPTLLTWGGFDGPVWITSMVLFAILDSAIEGLFVRFAFRREIPFGGYLLLAVANLIGLSLGVMLHLMLAMAKGV